MSINSKQTELSKNDLKWKNTIHFSRIINSMIVFFSSKSNKFLKNNFSKYELNYKYIIKFANDFNFIKYIYNIICSNDFNSGITLYHQNIKNNVLKFKLPKFKTFGNEEKDIILSPSTKFFGVEYLFHKKFKNNIKIQESFNDFKLFSIYVEIEKYYSIIKIKNIWYIFDERIGYTIIPFTISKNFIIFEPIQLNDSIFSFDKIKYVIIFYLRNGSRIPQTKIIKEINNLDLLLKPIKYKDDFENIECDCNRSLGWLQHNSPDYPGSYWFDAGMLAIFIPIKLRKIFLKPASEKFKIPQEYLFPCDEFYNISAKNQLIENLIDFDVNLETSYLLTIPIIFFSALDDIKKIPLYNQIDKNIFYKLSPKKSKIFFHRSSRKIYYKDFNLKYNFFIISQVGYFQNPKENLFDFQLQSIIINFVDDNKNHAVSFIKCKQGWFLYDNDLALNNQDMIKLKYSIKNGYLIFKPFVSFIEFNSSQIVNKIINVDLFKASERNYLYAK